MLAETLTGMGLITAADIIAGAHSGDAGGIRTLHISYGSEDGRSSSWAGTRDESGQLSDDPLPEESTLTTAAEMHDRLAAHRARHTIIVAVDRHAHTWPAEIEEDSEQLPLRCRSRGLVSGSRAICKVQSTERVSVRVALSWGIIFCSSRHGHVVRAWSSEYRTVAQK